MSSAVERATSVNGCPMTGLTFGKYCPFDRRYELAADKVVVALSEGILYPELREVE